MQFDPSKRQSNIVQHHYAVKGRGESPNALYSGKVIAVNHNDSTVDLKMFNGDTLRRVRVLQNSANTVAGMRYLPTVKNVNPQATSKGVDDTGLLGGEQDTVAIVSYLNGNHQLPIVVGFQFPRNSQLHLTEDGLYVLKHESGVYETIDSTGTKEVHYPDGSYLIFGQRNTPKNMGTIQGNGQAWSTPSAANIQAHMHFAQGVDITIQNGQINITTNPNGFIVNGKTLA